MRRERVHDDLLQASNAKVRVGGVDDKKALTVVTLTTNQCQILTDTLQATQIAGNAVAMLSNFS
jgi:hypothetical protein